MKRQISANVTVTSKYLFAFIWSGCFGVVTLLAFAGHATFTSHGQPLSPAQTLAAKWVLLAVTLGGSALVWWFSDRVKQVLVDETALYVSNLRREIVVPFSEVRAVRVDWKTRVNDVPLVTIELRQRCAFGRQISFLPVPGAAPQVVVADLEALIGRAAPQLEHDGSAQAAL